jgi:hypothetical protein
MVMPLVLPATPDVPAPEYQREHIIPYCNACALRAGIASVYCYCCMTIDNRDSNQRSDKWGVSYAPPLILTVARRSKHQPIRSVVKPYWARG